MCAVVYFITPETRRRRKKNFVDLDLDMFCVSLVCVGPIIHMGRLRLVAGKIVSQK